MPGGRVRPNSGGGLNHPRQYPAITNMIPKLGDRRQQTILSCIISVVAVFMTSQRGLVPFVRRVLWANPHNATDSPRYLIIEKGGESEERGKRGGKATAQGAKETLTYSSRLISLALYE